VGGWIGKFNVCMYVCMYGGREGGREGGRKMRMDRGMMCVCV